MSGHGPVGILDASGSTGVRDPRASAAKMAPAFGIDSMLSFDERIVRSDPKGRVGQ